MRSVKIRYLSKREIRKFVQRVKEEWGVEVRPERMKVVTLKKGELFIGGPTFLMIEDVFVPFLNEKGLVERLPKVIVDMGAVPHIVKGANVMRPGIVEIKGDLMKGGLVSVVDEKHNKAIAVGLWEVEPEEFETMKKGVVVRTLHYVGDEFWEAAKELNIL